MPMTDKQRAEIHELKTVLSYKHKKYNGLHSILQDMWDAVTAGNPYKSKSEETPPPEIKALQKELDGLKGEPDEITSKSKELILELSKKSRRVCESLEALDSYVDEVLNIEKRGGEPATASTKDKAKFAVNYLDSLRTKGTVVGEFFKGLAELFVLIKRFFAPGQIGEAAQPQQALPAGGEAQKPEARVPTEKMFHYSTGKVAGRLFQDAKKHDNKAPQDKGSSPNLA